MEYPTHIAEIPVYETYLDVFGHVNHAKYLELYEQARWDWMASYNLSLKDIHRLQVGPVILNVNLDYRREVLARQTLRIHTRVADYQKKIFTLAQEMRLPNGELASTLQITGGMMDLNARKLVMPPEIWLQAFGMNEKPVALE
jgi:thioesterase III